MAAEPPPWRYRAGYYVLGFTPPIEYRPWVEQDISSRGWLLRRLVLNGAMLGLGALVGSLLVSQPVPVLAWAIGAGAGALVLLARPNGHRRWTRRYHEWRWASRSKGERGITGPASPE